MKLSSSNHGLRSFVKFLSTLIGLFLVYSIGTPVESRVKLHQLGFESNSYRFAHGERILMEVESNSSTSITKAEDQSIIASNDEPECKNFIDHPGSPNACEFLKANPTCSTGGFLDYLRFLNCDCQGHFRFLGYLALVLWLVTLFYLLGNTAADYFCCSLEKLSTLLNLPPTVAGVALLPLGNGAPDVFSSVAAFMSKDAGQVGLNSVLGGAVFVTCVVVGVVSLLVSEKEVRIDQRCFIRDISFFLFSLFALLVIMIVGKVSVAAAVTFLSIYILYAFSVAANELLRKHAQRLKLDALVPLIPVRGSVLSRAGTEEDVNVYSSLLDVESNEVPYLPSSLPSWMWASNVAIFSNNPSKNLYRDEEGAPWGWSERSEETRIKKTLGIIEAVLALPRRLTIPLVEEETWSKTYAVSSAVLAPILVVWLTSGTGFDLVTLFGILVGCGLGALAYRHTVADHPPRRFVLLWVAGGFMMSIVWFYMIANELVALLMTFGVVLGINPSILGLTVLAWGNSMGDLVSNVALAVNGEDSVQIAFSGCYAGPMFNTLVGLGVSMLLGAWSGTGGVYKVPHDFTLYFTMGFLVLGLLWALGVLTRNHMRPTKALGIGLLILYLIFLVTRMVFSIRNGSNL